MKNTSGRIPTATGLFNDYINNTEPYLRAPSPVPSRRGTSAHPGTPPSVTPVETNWQRLGMLMDEMDRWTDFQTQWNELYKKYSDKEISRTTVITNKLRNVQNSFKTFAQRLLNMMAGSRSATEDDASALNFVLTRAEPSRSNTPIDDVPIFGAVPLGGGVIKFSVHPANDSTRASILEEASGVEIRYEIGETSGTAGPSYIFFTSTRAIFNLTLPESSQGKTMSVSARWIVASDQSLNGPWSNVLRVVVA